MTSLSCDVLAALKGKTLVTAESCTGGGIGAALTAIPGSSEVYKGGIISYTNWVKNRLLGVDQKLLDREGAVSAAVAEAMAQGAKADGDVDKVGTDGFFALYYSAKTKIDGSNKTFDDAYSASQRINMGAVSSFSGTVKNAIEFTTDGPATVKVWWVCGGDGRELQLAGADGAVLESREEACVKNSLHRI